MFFDILLVCFSAFISYCCYIAVVIPYQEKKRNEALRVKEWVENMENYKKV